MLDELRAVLASCPPNATRDDYLTAIHEDNCLGKRTAATRKLSSQRLSELYALDPQVPLFRVMRRGWYADPYGQALLALLLALARDPLLRASAPPVLRMRPGEELARQQMTDEAWFLADLAGMKKHFGGNFDSGKLPAANLAETRTKGDIRTALRQATRNTPAKEYKKIRDGAKLLEKVDPAEVRRHCRWCDRLFQELGKAIGARL